MSRIKTEPRQALEMPVRRTSSRLKQRVEHPRDRNMALFIEGEKRLKRNKQEKEERERRKMVNPSRDLASETAVPML
jgi:hypothetical protein